MWTFVVSGSPVSYEPFPPDHGPRSCAVSRFPSQQSHHATLLPGSACVRLTCRSTDRRGHFTVTLDSLSPVHELPPDQSLLGKAGHTP